MDRGTILLVIIGAILGAMLYATLLNISYVLFMVICIAAIRYILNAW